MIPDKYTPDTLARHRMTHEESVCQPWVPDVVSNSRQVKGEDVEIRQGGDECAALCRFVRFPQPPIRIREYRYGRYHTYREQEEVCRLEHVQGVLEIVVRIRTTVDLTQVLQECCNLGCMKASELMQV